MTSVSTAGGGLAFLFLFFFSSAFTAVALAAAVVADCYAATTLDLRPAQSALVNVVIVGACMCRQTCCTTYAMSGLVIVRYWRAHYRIQGLRREWDSSRRTTLSSHRSLHREFALGKGLSADTVPAKHPSPRAWVDPLGGYASRGTFSSRRRLFPKTKNDNTQAVRAHCQGTASSVGWPPPWTCAWASRHHPPLGPSWCLHQP
jgi:hypothetical protein